MGTCTAARYRAMSEHLFHPDLGGYFSYAIVCEEKDKDECWIVTQEVRDVSDSSETVSKLVRLFNEGDLAPCHLYEVIENWLNL